jgi:FkbM family methyltransferase
VDRYVEPEPYRRLLLSHAPAVRECMEQHLENASDVWGAWCHQRPLPVLRLRGGIAVYHAPCDPVMVVLVEIFLCQCYTGGGYYDPAPGDTVLDCGANIGLFALFLASRTPAIHLHCYEPASDTRDRLVRNVASNGLDTSITVHPFGLWRSQSRLSLADGRSSGHRTVHKSAPDVATTPIDCVDLACAVDKAGAHRVQLLKIDTEGAELEILDGAPPATLERIDRIAVECHDHLRPGTTARLIELLRSRGFDAIDVLSTFPQTPQVPLIRAARRPR